MMRQVVLLVLVLGTSPSLRAGESQHAVFADQRDRRVYPTVEIAGMTWFAHNLDWAAPGSFCYDDDQANCGRYGRLYRWEDAVKACPPGSHLASELEWQALERSIGLPEVEIEQRRNRGTVEGARLKPGGDTGFDAQYGGWRRYEDGAYQAADENVAYWTATEVDLAHAQHRDIDTEDDMIWRSPVVKHYALSVRCVVDRYDGDEYPGDDTHPAFSPDGERIAYISNREGVAAGHPINFEIYVLNLATKKERRLTHNDAFEADLAWSPDGRAIAFKSYRDGNDEIYIMAADGADPINLTRDEASDSSPSFTPDGEFIVFASDRGGTKDLYRMRRDGSEVVPLAEHPANDNSPSVSPDGRRVAFVSDRDGNDEVYILELASSDVRRLTRAPLADWSPVWSRDGQSLIVTYGDWQEDAWSVVRISVDGGRRETLFEGTDSGTATWRPSDGALAFGAPSQSGDDVLGPGRIHLGLPGGSGRQPLTGRLAGTHGD